MKTSKARISDRRYFLVLIAISVCLISIIAWSGKMMRTVSGKEPLSQETKTLEPRPYKYIGKYMTFSNEPVDVLDIRLKGNPVQINSKVKESGEWLDGFSFKARNISGKNIVYLYIQIIFPETRPAKGQPVMVFPIRYGSDPMLPGKSIEQDPLGPNEEIEFEVVGAEYEKLKRFVEKKTPINTINAIFIDVAMVIFDDDTAWDTGSFLRRDPNNPRRWIDIK